MVQYRRPDRRRGKLPHRMRRKLFTLAAALSAALCVAACVLWVRSYWAGDAVSINLPQFGRPLADETLNLVSGRGGLCVSVDWWARWELGVFQPTRADLHATPVVHTTFKPFYPYALNRATFRRLGSNSPAAAKRSARRRRGRGSCAR